MFSLAPWPPVANSCILTNPLLAPRPKTALPIPGMSNRAHESLLGCPRISYQQQHQEHSNERHDSGHHDDAIKGMPGGDMGNVGKISNEFESDDGPNARARPAQS